MALLISLETATQMCSVALAKDGEVLAVKESSEDKSHSSQITVFIEEVLAKAGAAMKDVEGVAVSEGPGSYTGLRIGVSTAKGLCYGLDIPLIAVNTLQTMALGASIERASGDNTLYCPLIDARRMEVYYALYNGDNEMAGEVRAEIVDESFLQRQFKDNKIVFFGDAVEKCQKVLGQNPNAVFLQNHLPTASNMAILAEKKYGSNQFEDVAYFEPFYLKDFVAVKSKKFQLP
ncbi:MAG TPA: tRNA (adenosine(37)-N6)-threonylcarbamoyltransferase complex dimerization subunit type 1 TsaB [Flavobacteriales bacterium]|nr:tRNA (adenosine(37)-N6)-threonylcarbamoyltransferase complex dimerization subunit type 1 TsaB [Flavobacteriales bacterium]HIA12682.1 tRNA (adenosine(37)-N6)-threonylcarbamoyltransferase complex dimerization subunit type 1 TsaB [Flavobacteriales bacterium]